MKFQVLVGADAFWQRLREDIAGARKRVLVQAMTFEADSAGLPLADAMINSAAKDKRLLVDAYIKHVINDHILFTPAAIFNRKLQKEARQTRYLLAHLNPRGVFVKLTNPVFGPLMVRYPARNHKKMIVIDHDICYLGGFNFSAHNFSWHDMMIRCRSRELAAFLRQDFEATWQGLNNSLYHRGEDADLYLCNGAASRELYQQIFGLIASAKKAVLVHSPYVTYPFSRILRRVAQRGIPVTILTPEKNNKPLAKHFLVQELNHPMIDLRFRPGNMSHLKAILIDNEYLIAGSSNFDMVSYYLEQELIAIFRDQELISEFRRRIIIPDLENSIAQTHLPRAGHHIFYRHAMGLFSLYCKAVGKLFC